MKRAFIIYSAISKIPRRLIVTTDKIDLNDHIGLGEDGFAIAHKSLIRNKDGTVCPQFLRQMVANFHKIDPATIPEDRCALVCKNTGLVHNLVNADPDFDLHPTHHVRGAGHDVMLLDKHDGEKYLPRHHVVINGALDGFVWDTKLPAELDGLCHRDVNNEWGDKQIGDPIDVAADDAGPVK